MLKNIWERNKMVTKRKKVTRKSKLDRAIDKTNKALPFYQEMGTLKLHWKKKKKPKIHKRTHKKKR